MDSSGGASPPVVEAGGLRRSKRKNKYHLNVASLLLSSSNTILRDVSPPSPVKTHSAAQQQKQRREKGAKMLATTGTLASSTPLSAPPRPTIVTAFMTESTNGGVQTTTTASSKCTATAWPTCIGTSSTTSTSSISSSATTTIMMTTPSAPPAVTNVAGDGMQLKMLAQLPDQILEDEEDQCNNNSSRREICDQQQRTPTADGSVGTTTKSGTSFCNQPAEPAVDDGMQLRMKRKRKVPLKHRDYFNGVEAEDSEDDELEEQLQSKALKVEYTSAENSKPDDHACPKCPAIFDSRVGLTNHLKLHGTEKEFPCELCDFSCTNKKTMRQHRRVHGLSRRSRTNHTVTATTTNVVVKGEFAGSAATAAAVALKSSSTAVKQPSVGKPPSAAALPTIQWAKHCYVNLDILEQRRRSSNNDVATTASSTATETKATMFKPINSSSSISSGCSSTFYTHKYCSTVADVAKLVNQMHEQQLKNQRKAQQQQKEAEEEEAERRKNSANANNNNGTRIGKKKMPGTTTTTTTFLEAKDAPLDNENNDSRAADDDDGMPILEQQQQQNHVHDGVVEEGHKQPQQRNTMTIGFGGNAFVRHANAEIESSCDAVIANVRKTSFSTSNNSGKAVYDRNTIQCPHCPFRTQSRQRLEPHLRGHTRTYGFQCSACGFKSDSSGFIRRHSQLHDEPCKWPPDYVGVPDNERLLAKLLEGGRCFAAATAAVPSSAGNENANNDYSNGTDDKEIVLASSSSSLSSSESASPFDACSMSKQSSTMQCNSHEGEQQATQHHHHQQQDGQSATTVVVNSMHKLIKMEMIEFNEDDEHDQIGGVGAGEAAKNNDDSGSNNSVAVEQPPPPSPPLPSASSNTVLSGNGANFRWTFQLIAQRWHAYRKKCLQIRSSPGYSTTTTNLLLTAQPHHTLSLLCRRCQLQLRSGPVHLALHNARHHRIMGTDRHALCRELLAERLAWRDDRSDGIEFEFTTLTTTTTPNGRGDADECRSPSTSASIDISSSTTTQKTTATVGSPTVGKVFRCRNCPFSTDQIFRLQKHENKHLIKSDHQCPHCSFSCRSLDILAQHKRLHEDTEQQQQQNCSSSSNGNDKNGTLPTTATVPTSPTAAFPSAQFEQKTAFASPPQQQQMALSSARLAPIRRNEAHYCPHCPYSSKHNCDMKAHMRMHEVRSKFACSLCTYSSKRQNALIAHEQLHRKGPLLGSPAVLGPRGAKCRRLKRIILLLHHHRRHSLSASVPIGERIRFDGACTHFYRCAHRQCREEVPFCADLVRHARNHRTKAGLLFRCDHCTFSSMLEHRLNTHQLVTHNRYAAGGDESGEEKNSRTDAGIFNCKECPFFTVNYAKFWNHRQKHKRTNRFTCKHCSFSSGSVQCYAEHMALHGDTFVGIGTAITSNNNNSQEFGITGPQQVATAMAAEQHQQQPSSSSSSSTVAKMTKSGQPGIPSSVPQMPSSEIAAGSSSSNGNNNNLVKNTVHQMMIPSSADDNSSPSSSGLLSTNNTMATTTTAKIGQIVGQLQRQNQQKQADDSQGGVEMTLDKTTTPLTTDQTVSAEMVKADQQVNVVLQSSKPAHFLDMGSSSSSSAAAAAASADFSSTAFHTMLSTFTSSAKMLCCNECPFETVHSALLRLHMEMHRNSACRPFSCALCSFSCFAAESLHAHLALHASATTLEGTTTTTGNNNNNSYYCNNDGGAAYRTHSASAAAGGQQQQKQPTPDTEEGTHAAAAVNQNSDGPFSVLVSGAFSSPPLVSTSTLSSYACSQCSFKCSELESFLNHRKEHVQLIQQRLMTIIKRAAVMENYCVGNGGTTKMDKMLKANGIGSGRTVDKQHYCTRCSFRCDSVQAFTRHWEHHRIDNCRPGIFQCSACDYSSDTRNVVLFHEHNHHLDIPLTSLCKNIELVKEQQKRHRPSSAAAAVVVVVDEKQ